MPTVRHVISPARVCAWLICLAVSVLAGCAARPHTVAASANHGWTRDEVSDSYLFGYPLVVMTSARAAASVSGAAGVNTLRRAKAPPAADDPGMPPQPDIDMLSSTGWLDLTAEPVLLSLPDTRGQYLDARALDMWTNVVWSARSPLGMHGIAKRRAIAFVAPGWSGELPEGVERIDAPGTSLWLSVDIAATEPRELAAARRLQDEIRVTPLSAFEVDDHEARTRRMKEVKRGKPVTHESRESGESASAGGDDDPPWFADTPAAQTVPVASLNAGAFFRRLADALRDNPPSPADPHALAILADFGVKPGEPVRLPDGAADAIVGGLVDGRARIATAPDNALSVNGWSWLGDGVGHYGEDYALRAYAAYRQPGSGTKEDEVVAAVTVDGEGKALDGGDRYVLHFPARALPPARAFWTLAAYTKGGALVEGRVPHRSIVSRDALRRNRDSSLDIYVQAASPKCAPQANWLPAPAGAFKLVMRLYAPQPSAIDGTWQPPALVRQ